ncbi:MAG TPA: hypothetical protein VEK07_09860 [Polyangiaceae bacterium]|nr:hypothetical protein [Polyangiaceae bacterium]
MRVPVVLVAFTAIFFVGLRPAAAVDAGEFGSVDADPAEPSDQDSAADATSEQADVEAVGDSSASSEAPVIACDGALCDTTQGRPTCTVAPRSFGHAEVDPGMLAGIASALVLGLARRVKRGT